MNYVNAVCVCVGGGGPNYTKQYGSPPHMSPNKIGTPPKW